jgi:hypothetical protein
MIKKFVVALLAVALSTGAFTAVAATSASAGVPVTLSGAWKCPTGDLTVTFVPPLKAGAAGNSTFTVKGEMKDCKEPANAVQSPEAKISGFTGTIASNCAALSGSPAPAMNMGVFTWAPKGGTKFVPSTNITFPAGNVIGVNGAGKLTFYWPSGTIGAGSEAGPVYLKAGSEKTAAQLGAACTKPGIKELTLTGKDA